MDESQIKKELSLRIKAYRKSRNLTQDEFGALIGFEQKNVSRLESGNSFPDIKTICKLIEAGVESDYLFGFLNLKNKKYNSKDYEIIELLLELSDDAKEYFKNFLKEIKAK